jgi:hypothetical protein
MACPIWTDRPLVNTTQITPLRFSNHTRGRNRGKYQIDNENKNGTYSGFREYSAMPADPVSQPATEPDRLDAATAQVIAAYGGDARQAVTALIVANEFLEAQVRELQTAVSHGYRPPVHMIKLTHQRNITPYKWVHPNDDERR